MRSNCNASESIVDQDNDQASSVTPTTASEKSKKDQSQQKPIFKIKKPNLNSACGHKESRYYARGYCKECYFKYGKAAVAITRNMVCGHDQLGRVHHARGMCKSCYNNIQRKKKKKAKQIT